jgi:hypothetical protein
MCVGRRARKHNPLILEGERPREGWVGEGAFVGVVPLSGANHSNIHTHLSNAENDECVSAEKENRAHRRTSRQMMGILSLKWEHSSSSLMGRAVDFSLFFWAI